MSAQDWYARKLGQQQPQRPQQPQFYRQQPPQAPPRQQLDYSAQTQRVDTAPEAPPPPGSVTVQNFVEMASRWRGGPAARSEKTPCPECGGPNFFSRAGNSRMGAPAPHCYNCGYSGGLIPTQGDPASWGAA